MILDVRTMYVAMAATCFIVAAALLTLRVRRVRRDGALLWAVGCAFQGAFWVLLGLRGIIGDFLSIVIAHTCLTAGFSLLYAAVRQFQGRPYNTCIILFPVAATFSFFWYFSAYVDNLSYRIIFISFLTVLQISGIVLALVRNGSVNERRSYWLTGFAFFVMVVVLFKRLIEALTLPYGQLSVLQPTAFRGASVVMTLAVVVLSSIGFVLMIRDRAEEALRWSEQRFRSLFETSRDSILLINQETGQVLGANPAACRLYGLLAGGVSRTEGYRRFGGVGKDRDGDPSVRPRSSLPPPSEKGRHRIRGRDQWGLFCGGQPAS
ncbi:MAG: PAS domain-containing protein [Syntrophorhabdales bacterium]|jgi:PAS domain-containing protein